MNTTVQGSAADIVKTATVNIQRRLEAFSSEIKSHGHLESSLQRGKTGMLASALHTRVKLPVLLFYKAKACKKEKKVKAFGPGVGDILFLDNSNSLV